MRRMLTQKNVIDIVNNGIEQGQIEVGGGDVALYEHFVVLGGLDSLEDMQGIGIYFVNGDNSYYTLDETLDNLPDAINSKVGQSTQPGDASVIMPGVYARFGYVTTDTDIPQFCPTTSFVPLQDLTIDAEEMTLLAIAAQVHLDDETGDYMVVPVVYDLTDVEVLSYLEEVDNERFNPSEDDSSDE